MIKTCQYSNNEKSCRAYAISNSKYCFWHDPNMVSSREAARRKGGLNRRIVPEGLNSIPEIHKAQDVEKVIANTIREVQSMPNSLSRARCIGSLCITYLKVHEKAEIEKQQEENQSIFSKDLF